ncbi:hypothetical protein AB0J28_42145 [Streptosporangium canum]|uniref:hypothetical protein n=1 Tax=Streptosporangium canum TaxID=324952 RepID=UPI0034233A6B
MPIEQFAQRMNVGPDVPLREEAESAVPQRLHRMLDGYGRTGVQKENRQKSVMFETLDANGSVVGVATARLPSVGNFTG